MPRNNYYDHYVSTDNKNGNHLWVVCVKLETYQQYQHETYKNMGARQAPKCYKKILAHFVFDKKYDDRHKARLLADGHLTNIPL